MILETIKKMLLCLEITEDDTLASYEFKKDMYQFLKFLEKHHSNEKDS